MNLGPRARGLTVRIPSAVWWGAAPWRGRKMLIAGKRWQAPRESSAQVTQGHVRENVPGAGGLHCNSWLCWTFCKWTDWSAESLLGCTSVRKTLPRSGVLQTTLLSLLANWKRNGDIPHSTFNSLKKKPKRPNLLENANRNITGKNKKVTWEIFTNAVLLITQVFPQCPALSVTFIFSPTC